jgi:hypothetical protein
VADVGRLRGLTGWTPARDLVEGLSATVAAEKGESSS